MIQFLSQHQFWAVSLAAAALFSATACARYAVHPGAVNKADSAAYDTLLIAESVIDQARSEVSSPTEKDALNTLVASYNAARESWLTYRGAIATNTPARPVLSATHAEPDRLNQCHPGITRVGCERKRDSAQPSINASRLRAQARQRAAINKRESAAGASATARSHQ